MQWGLLLVAGLLEVCWAIGMKNSDGFRHTGWTIFTTITLAGSMFLLAQALRHLPVGTAYAVWTGIGTVGAALLGMILLDESRAPGRLFFIGVIVLGIIGLRVTSPD